MSVVPHRSTSGQSLSNGHVGSPALSRSTAPFETSNAFMLAVAADGTQGPGLGPLIPKPDGAVKPQRPDLSLGYRMAETSLADRWVFDSFGVGASSVVDLSQGGASGAYEAQQAGIAAAVAAVGPDVLVEQGQHWIQGERDQYIGTTIANYISQMQALMASHRTATKAKTGQTTDWSWFLSQTATWPYYNNPARIGLAQLQMGRTLARVVLVGGQYQLPYAGDFLHLTNRGYYFLGELHARAALAVAGGGTWLPFAPKTAGGYTITADRVVVHYDVPAGPLVLDTTTVPQQTNYGFSLTGTLANITGVTVSGSDVTLFTDRQVTEQGAAVGYGVSAHNQGVGLGNLRDSHPGVSKYDGTPLRNWALHSLDDLGLNGAPPAQVVYNVAKVYRMDAAGAIRQITLAKLA